MKRMNIARSIGFPLRKILHCDVTKVFPLFDGVRLVRYKKHKILKISERDLQEEDYKLN